MNINRFMSNIDNMARTNHFNVNIFGPVGISAGLSIRGIRCTNISLPGRSFITTPYEDYAGAPKSNRITGIDYEGGIIQMTFICDSSFEDKQKLELWQQYIFDDDYFYKYYDEYVGSVTIVQEGVDGQPIYDVTLHDAFPQALQAQTLDASTNSVQSFTCSFAYRTWTSSFENSPSGILGGLFKKFTRKLSSKIDKKFDRVTSTLTRKAKGLIEDLF